MGARARISACADPQTGDRMRYASKETQQLAQMQGTGCSCAPNTLAYKESYEDRLGNFNASVFALELPSGSCDTAPPPSSTCVTQARKPPLSNGSTVEWAALFTLAANHTYWWTFHAYSSSGTSATARYPDRGIDVYVAAAPSGGLSDALSRAADAALRASSAQPSSTTQVGAGGEVVTLNPKPQNLNPKPTQVGAGGEVATLNPKP